MPSMHRTTVEELGIVGVLKALEEASRTPSIHLKDFNAIFSWENWSAYQNVNFNEKNRLVDAGSVSRLMTSAFEMNAIVSMLKTLLDFASVFQDHLNRIQRRIISKLSRGIDSLPDELLPVIFKFAVWDEGHRGARQAIRLSQVSQRFRDIALGERSLWTTLRSVANDKELETLISRSGADADFHVFIQYDAAFNAWGLGWFMNVCQPIVSRWKTLSLTDVVQGWDDDERLLSGNVGTILDSLQSSADDGVLFSRLEEIYAHSYGGDYADSQQPEVTLSWTSPNLRSLRFSRYLPSPSIVFSLVTTFAFTEHMPTYDYVRKIKPTLTFLPSMPNLTHFELELYIVGDIAIKEPLHLPETMCPSITSFQLRLREFELSRGRGQEKFVVSLLQALRMPLLEELFICIGFRDMYIDATESECTELLAGLSCALLPAHVSDPCSRLSSLAYKTWYNDGRPRLGYGIAQILPAEFPIIFTVPLDRIPSVSTLTLTMCARVLCTREGRFAANAIREPCQLQELRLVGCMEIEALKGLVQSLKDAGAWDTLERVIMEDCCRESYDGVLEIIGKDRLQYSI